MKIQSVATAVILGLLPTFLEASATVPIPFLKDRYVPVSPYVLHEGAGEVSLSLRPEVLDFVRRKGKNLFVASCPAGIEACQSGQVLMSQKYDIDSVLGRIVQRSAEPGVYAVLTDAFANDLPIVTHWDQSLHGGRGGQRIGGTDSLGPIVLNPETGKSPGLSQFPFAFLESDRRSPYIFDTDTFALLGPESGNRVVDYEHYLGEDYSLTSWPDSSVGVQSHFVLLETGWPIVHKNGGDANFDSIAEEGIPAFQVIHAARIRNGKDKNSLVSIMLPPGWHHTALRQEYPVLFYGFYDVHYTFSSYNLAATKVVHSMIQKGLSSPIVVFWNGGGAYGARTLHRSAFDNAAILFDRIKNELSADSQKVVTVGCSRGGGTALAIAANPYHDNYRVREAIAYSPGGIRMGEYGSFPLQSHTYPGMHFVLERFTGYRFSWQENWRDPIGRTAGEVMSHIGVGTTDPSLADELSLNSRRMLQALKRKGTQISLTIGTHDAFQVFFQNRDFYENAVELDIPIHLRVEHRFGHCGNFDHAQAGEKALIKILNQDESFEQGVQHVLRKSEAEWNMAETFIPTEGQEPAFAELPRLVILDGSFRAVVGGGPEMQYEVKIWKIEDQAWRDEKRIAKVGEPLRFPGAVSQGGRSRLATDVIRTKWSDLRSLGMYTYELHYRYPQQGDSWKQANKTVATSDKNRYPIFEVLDKEPTQGGTELYVTYTSDMRGFGVSTD